MSDKAAFDAWAQNYDVALARGLAATGESREYFAHGRVVETDRVLRRLRLRPRRVLDLGCGTGASSPLLHQLLEGEAVVVGVDPSAESIARARDEHGGPGVSFATLAEYQPTGDFDLVYCNGVVHHIPLAERAAFLALVRRALAPGGIFAMWENNPWNPGTRWVMSRIPFDRDAIVLSPRFAKRWLSREGFGIDATVFAFFFPAALAALRPLEARLRWLPLGGQYGVFARSRRAG